MTVPLPLLVSVGTNFFTATRAKGDADKQIEEWSSLPQFDFLEPAPWSTTLAYFQATVGVFALGFTLAFLAHQQGVKFLAKPAKYIWTAALLLLTYTLGMGLPRTAKFIILFFFGGICVLPLLLIVGSIWVYTGSLSSDEGDKGKEGKEKEKDASGGKGEIASGDKLDGKEEDEPVEIG